MKKVSSGYVALELSGLTSSSCQPQHLKADTLRQVEERAGRVDDDRLVRADAEPDQWMSSGRDQQGSYFSPLADINGDTVDQLGFAWQHRTGTSRGLEATPLVVDGIMYTSDNWGIVYALNAATRKLIWTFDPMNDGQRARYACCDVMNRGVVVWKGSVYVASLDGRLFAIDAATGRMRWSVDTIVEPALI